ncbi:hypothetical protein ACFVVL_11805 [Kitasatospora sp. NPDC058115]|uniref:hypothetical protein n=1 Tax=Kitasatospora sp. NPDC058115 TaxID=3346347 RepID=UPI0036DD92D3
MVAGARQQQGDRGADGSLAGLALSPDDPRLLGVNGGGRGFTVDLAADTVTASYDITPHRWLRTLSVNTAGTRLYTLSQDASLLAIDTAANAVAPGEGVAGLSASDVELGPDRHTFYAVSGADLRIIGF